MKGIIIDISNIFDRYEQLNAAKVACANDSNCIAIYEPFCDKNGPFMLLKDNFVTSAYGNNCIYKKKEDGKCYYLRYIISYLSRGNLDFCRDVY